MNNKERFWFAVVLGDGNYDWGDGSFNFAEAVDMLHALNEHHAEISLEDDNKIVVISQLCDKDGNALTPNCEAVAEYTIDEIDDYEKELYADNECYYWDTENEEWADIRA